eukprot:7877759-Alexandrium_andersonii.AAC.1
MRSSGVSTSAWASRVPSKPRLPVCPRFHCSPLPSSVRSRNVWRVQCVIGNQSGTSREGV